MLLIGAPLRHNGPALQLRAGDRARPAARRRARRASCPTTASTTRSAGSPTAATSPGRRSAVAGQDVPFGTDLIFAAERPRRLRLPHRDLRGLLGRRPRPRPPAALAGATILANLSASNITIGKADERHLLCRVAVGARRRRLRLFGRRARREHHRPRLGRPGRDLRARRPAGRDRALPAASPSSASPTSTPAASSASACGCRPSTTPPRRPGAPEDRFRRVRFEHRPALRATSASIRPIRRFPFVPNRPTQLDQDCYEAFNIQVEGLRRRFEATSGEHMVIGVSGGLDSTHALIVAAKVCDRLGLPRTTILGFTMPGFATGEATKAQRLEADAARSASPARRSTSGPPARQMLRRHRPPLRRGRAGLRHHLRERAGGPAHRLSVPPRQPAPAASSSAPATSPSWRSAGAPTASATR